MQLRGTEGVNRASAGFCGAREACGRVRRAGVGGTHPRAGPPLSLGHSPEARVLVDRFIGEEEGLGSASFHRAGFELGQREPRAA